MNDIVNRVDIEQFVTAFYARLLKDEVLASIFIDTANIDLDVHLPHIVDYWAKLLLGANDYKRHTMNIHRALHSKRSLAPDDFKRWFAHFENSIDALFCGPIAERAKNIAQQIAINMAKALGSELSEAGLASS